MSHDFFENAPNGYFSFFDDGTIYVVNETLCTLLGYEKPELQGKNVETIFTLPTRIFYQTHFFPLVKMHGHAEEIFLSLRTKDNQFLPVLLNAKHIEQANAYTICAFIVVHNRKKFEDELVNARNAAEAALKENSELIKIKADLQRHMEELDIQIQTVNKQNEELKQLNHVVTHSLKEPVRKILVYTEKMQMEGLPDNVQDNVARLTRASDQLKTIVSGLQQYVWLLSVSNNFSIIDINGLIQQVADQLRSEHHSDQLVLDVRNIHLLEADRDQVELLLYHVLSNAIKFKKSDKAIVTVTGTVIKLNTFRAVPGKYKYEDFLKFEIRDEGIGFDPEYRDNLFALFKRLDYTKGQGLGLALCKKIAENHSGSIEAHGKLNEFTIITVFFPLTHAR
jgi:sigma-B regulation protein RsbU (phosphoserine phosphatase)